MIFQEVWNKFGSIYNLSRERIRQIEAKALRKFKISFLKSVIHDYSEEQNWDVAIGFYEETNNKKQIVDGISVEPFDAVKPKVQLSEKDDDRLENEEKLDDEMNDSEPFQIMDDLELESSEDEFESADDRIDALEGEFDGIEYEDDALENEFESAGDEIEALEDEFDRTEYEDDSLEDKFDAEEELDNILENLFYAPEHKEDFAEIVIDRKQYEDLFSENEIGGAELEDSTERDEDDRSKDRFVEKGDMLLEEETEDYKDVLGKIDNLEEKNEETKKEEKNEETKKEEKNKESKKEEKNKESKKEEKNEESKEEEKSKESKKEEKAKNYLDEISQLLDELNELNNMLKQTSIEIKSEKARKRINKEIRAKMDKIENLLDK